MNKANHNGPRHPGDGPFCYYARVHGVYVVLNDSSSVGWCASVELREYMSVRRGYNLVRQDIETKRRLTFEEFAILCRLSLSPGPVKTSSIASYQGALRPTMTHRTNHLAKLGLIERVGGSEDRRNVVCTISARGDEYVRSLCDRTRAAIPAGRPLARTSPDRIRKYVDAMGAVYCTAGDLILLALYEEESHSCTVMQLVDRLGLLQPTVSMSVGSLEKAGMIERELVNGSVRSAAISLTEAGSGEVEKIVERIRAVVVRRRPRKAKGASGASAAGRAAAAGVSVAGVTAEQVVPDVG